MAHPALKFFRYTKRETAYISWVGLRGAVPITLAIMPLTMGVPQSELLFEVAFAVVILSLMIQGSTISVVARLLKVVLPPRPEPLFHREIWLSDALAVSLQSFKVGENSDAENSHPDVMTRDPEFNEGRLFALIRHGETVQVDMQTKMTAGDIAWYVLPENKGNAFAEQFSARSDTASEQQFYGEFILNPNIQVGDLALHRGQFRDLDGPNRNIAHQRFRATTPAVSDLSQRQARGRHGGRDGIPHLADALDAFHLAIGGEGQHIDARQLPLVVDVHRGTLHHARHLEAGVGQVGRGDAGDVLVGDLVARPRCRLSAAGRPVDLIAHHLVVGALRVGRGALFDLQHRNHRRLGQHIAAAGEGAMDHRLGLLLGDLDVEHLRERRAVDRHHHGAIARIIEHLRFRGHPLQIGINGQTQPLRLAALDLEAIDVGTAFVSVN